MSCADCHMGVTADGRRRDHRFDVSRNPLLLRAALGVTARRLGPDRVLLELTPIAVGHALPAGDLFRRLELRVEARGSNGRPLAAATRYLARHFAPAAPHHQDPLAPDDRLTGPTALELLVPGAWAAQWLTWRVTYQRVDHRDAEAPGRSTLAGEIGLAGVNWPPTRPNHPRDRAATQAYRSRI